MIDLHQEDEKLFALVGACQRDVCLLYTSDAADD